MCHGVSAYISIEEEEEEEEEGVTEEEVYLRLETRKRVQTNEESGRRT